MFLSREHTDQIPLAHLSHFSLVVEPGGSTQEEEKIAFVLENPFGDVPLGKQATIPIHGIGHFGDDAIEFCHMDTKVAPWGRLLFLPPSA